MSKFKWKEIENYIASILLVAMVVVGAIGFSYRYFFQASLAWTEEFCRFSFIWFAYISSCYAITTRSHIIIDLMSSIFKGKQGKILQFIGKIIWLAFNVYIIILGVELTSKSFKMGELSAGMSMPMWIVYLVLPLSFTIMSIRLIQVIKSDIKAYIENYNVEERRAEL